MMGEQLRQAVRSAILAMDKDTLDRLAFTSGITGQEQLFSDTAYRTLAAGGHDVQRFWLGDCGCHQEHPQTKVAMGRPVTLQPELLELARRSPDIKFPPVYPGSHTQPCSNCQTPTWVGPRVQEALESDPTIQLMCYLCVVTTTAVESLENGGVDMAMFDLGNEYKT